MQNQPARELSPEKILQNMMELSPKEMEIANKVIKNYISNVNFEKDDFQKQATHNTILEKLSYNPKTQQSLNKYLNELTTELTIAKEILSKLPIGSETSEIIKNITNLKTNIEFMTNIKQADFFQIPLQLNEQQTNGELFVLKNKKKSKNPDGISSALLAIETQNMGHFETYLIKEGNKIECKFRLENETVIDLVKDNIIQLEALLKEYNFVLQYCSYEKLAKPFNLLDTSKKTKSRIENFVLDVQA